MFRPRRASITPFLHLEISVLFLLLRCFYTNTPFMWTYVFDHVVLDWEGFLNFLAEHNNSKIILVFKLQGPSVTDT